MTTNARPTTPNDRPSPAAAAPEDVRSEPGGLTAGHALSYAWLVWAGLIGLILVGAIAVLWVVFMAEGREANSAEETPMIGFYVGCGLLALSMAGTFVKRVYHGAYYRGERVAPDDYLKGMLAIWLPIGGAVIASLILTVVFANPLPTPVPAIVGIILLFIFLPNGHAMTRPHAGATDDPGSYEEPK